MVNTTYMNYDDGGVRVEKNAPTGITLYPFSGVEIDPNGVMTKHIRIGGEIFASKKGTNQYFYHNDHLGGINVITDISCIEVQRNEYDPWGSVSKAVGNLDPTHRFTGQELDPETGLYYYGGRYYDAEISRFVSPDPFVPSPDDPQSLNRYSYTINNPQRYIDPSGYEGEDSRTQYSYGLYGLVKFFIDVFSSHHHPPKRVPRAVSHPINQPRENNWGRPLSDSMRVYVNNGYLQTGLGFVEGDDQSNWDRLRLLRQAAEFFRDKVSRARKQIQRRLQTSIPSLCSYGGFGYFGGEFELGPAKGELIGVISYDSKEGGQHGGILAGGFGKLTGGLESTRTWSDWQEHTSNIAFYNEAFSITPRTLGPMDVTKGNYGGLFQFNNGELTVGGYLGLETGGERAFGTGAYGSWTWTGCK